MVFVLVFSEAPGNVCGPGFTVLQTLRPSLPGPGVQTAYLPDLPPHPPLNYALLVGAGVT